MKKTLVLMRHGKSSWKYDVDDHDRPLKSRAYEDIQLVSEQAKSKISSKAQFISSSANRALTTANLFTEYLSINSNQLQINPELYTFNVYKLKQIIYALDDASSEVVLFGHNPAFTMLANDLGNRYFNNIPTSGLVKLSFENTSWKDCKTAETLLHLFPKNLRS